MAAHKYFDADMCFVVDKDSAAGMYFGAGVGNLASLESTPATIAVNQIC